MERSFPIFENIWLADDDHDDCELFQDVLKEILPSVSLTIISNGEQLMDMLITSPQPDMLFLDINMPCKDGLDCLVEIRAQRKFSRLPIVVFSSSTQPSHIEVSYGYGANLFYSKPTSFQQLIAGLQTLFKMNWNDPYTITSNHFINNKFVPFNSSIQG